MSDEYNKTEAEYLLRESMNLIKGNIDQLYFGILDVLDEEEKRKFLENLKKQSDSLQNVLHESIIKKADVIKELNQKLISTNNELNSLKDSLEIKVNRKTKELKKIQHLTIFALTRLAEYRDKKTGVHLNRIRKYCYHITKELANSSAYKQYITEKYIQNIFFSSPLHDIGKVGISDKILLKPGKLTKPEFELVKKHTIIGGRTLEAAERQLKRKTASFLSMGKNIAYFHHEKWNGTGYPFGLKKDKIPLSARIVALADVYDAITTQRVYKEAMPHKKAKKIILSSTGKHFDPEIIDAFLKCNDIFEEISIANQ